MFAIAVTTVTVILFYAFFCNHTSNAELLRERAGGFEQSRNLADHARLMASWLDQHSVIAKWTNPAGLFITGLICFFARLNMPSYTLGFFHPHGVWYYFPTGLLFKMSPLFLVLLCLGVLIRIHQKLRPPQELEPETRTPGQKHLLATIVITLLVFTISAMASDINIGIRHFSVPILLMHVLVGSVMAEIQHRASHNLKWIMAAFWTTVLTGSLMTVTAAYPNYIAYFNSLRGDVPPQNILNDSNLDWGQNFPALVEFSAKHEVHNLYVNNMSMMDPGIYLPGAKPWVCGDEVIPKDAEWLAVSADFLTVGKPNCNFLMSLDHWVIGQGTTYMFKIKK
jgi:hypothetical protein